MKSVGGVGMDGGMRIGEGEGAWWFGVCILRGGEPSTGASRGTQVCSESRYWEAHQPLPVTLWTESL